MTLKGVVSERLNCSDKSTIRRSHVHSASRDLVCPQHKASRDLYVRDTEPREASFVSTKVNHEAVVK